jgi:metallo-beta-lactamase family protein
MKLTFLGAAGTVTGSKYLLEGGGKRILIDCGLFQGLKELRLRNWEAPAVNPGTLDAVVLTHAHLDHSGYLPRLVASGFKGPIWSTRGTRDLAAILLPDSAFLQEEDARHANKRRFSKHSPALPLYTKVDVEAALALFQTVEFDQTIELGGMRIRLSPAGHLLGAACVYVEADGTDVLFTGDVGRPNDPLMRPPRTVAGAKNLVVESTYGNRRHERSDPGEQLGTVLARVLGRGGIVMIPAFAVGRSQAILLLIARLKAAGTIPDVPVYLNSPMAIDATGIYRAHSDEHRISAEECEVMCRAATYVHTAEESKALNQLSGPMVLIAGSGMMTGGRILHHLVAFAPDPNNALLLVGYQAAGTRGEAIDLGADEVKIHGDYVPVLCERLRIDGMSGHADYTEIADWLDAMSVRPNAVYVTHGDPPASDAFRRYLADRFGWQPVIPKHGDTITLC